MKSYFAKTDNVFNNSQKSCFSLCIPIHLNQTAAGLFSLGKKKKKTDNNKNMFKKIKNKMELSVFAIKTLHMFSILSHCM